MAAGCGSSGSAVPSERGHLVPVAAAKLAQLITRMVLDHREKPVAKRPTQLGWVVDDLLGDQLVGEEALGPVVDEVAGHEPKRGDRLADDRVVGLREAFPVQEVLPHRRDVDHGHLPLRLELPLARTVSLTRPGTASRACCNRQDVGGHAALRGGAVFLHPPYASMVSADRTCGQSLPGPAGPDGLIGSSGTAPPLPDPKRLRDCEAYDDSGPLALAVTRSSM